MWLECTHTHTHTHITQLQKNAAICSYHGWTREYHTLSEVSHTDKDKYMVSLIGGT